MPTDRTLFHADRDGMHISALRRGTMKYIYQPGDRSMRTYDLSTDPLERNDLTSEHSPATIEVTEAELIVWQEDGLRAYRSARGE